MNKLIIFLGLSYLSWSQPCDPSVLGLPKTDQFALNPLDPLTWPTAASSAS